MTFDTIIVGGGPAGSTVGSLLRKYDPAHRVLILEREQFPRDHVGESQLPLIGAILDEMGVWNKVEAAQFPIKIGATYRWGATPDLWNFEFVPNGNFRNEPRPGTYQGQRQLTAFQVDRAVYDHILLDHAKSLGCEVRQSTKVAKILTDHDRIEGLILEDGTQVNARHYVDASGASGLIRRAMGVETESPTSLRNIAIWDYWQNAEWAEKIGTGGTRVQVLSLGYGWIWFIPIGPTRTSIGLVLPAEYYKQSGLKPAEIYQRALAEEPRIRDLIQRATPEGKLASTNDWSYLAHRLTGENWFLVGDACGFADPILAAGMTLAHGSAREVAYSILALNRGQLDPVWIRQGYQESHSRRIHQHIRFADFWYSANGQFSDLIDHTQLIARDAGLDLSPEQAFQWLGTGGFANDDLGQASIGTYSLASVKRLTQLFTGSPASWQINGFNEFRIDQSGVTRELRPSYEAGEILETVSWVKDGKVLPITGPFRVVINAINHSSHLVDIQRFLIRDLAGRPEADSMYVACLHALEALVTEGWVRGKFNKRKALGLNLSMETESATVCFHILTAVSGSETSLDNNAESKI